MRSIKVILRLLKAVDVVVVVVVVNVVVVALFVFIHHIIFMRWGGAGWGLHSHFHVQPNYSVEVVLSLGL